MKYGLAYVHGLKIRKKNSLEAKTRRDEAVALGDVRR